MTRTTRSRQAPIALKAETNAKTNTKRTITKKTTSEKNNNLKTNAKKILQDENAVPSISNNKVSNLKSIQEKTVLGSKLHSTTKDNSLVPKSTVLAIKSPVLRDRTNTTNELVSVEVSSNKNSDMVSNKNKKLAGKSTVLKTVKVDNDKNVKKGQMSIKNYVNKTTTVGKRNLRKRNSQEIEDEPVKTNSDIETASNEINSKRNSNSLKANKIAKVIQSDIEKNDEPEGPMTNKQTESQNVVRNRIQRRKNISQEELETLVNEDDIAETKFTITAKENELNIDKNDENLESNHVKSLSSDEVKAEQNNKVQKKFFKNIVVGELKPTTKTTLIKKNAPRKGKKANAVTKKIQNNDSTFSPNIEEERFSLKPPEKKLRRRAIKNYCEDSRLSQNSDGTENKPSSDDADIVKDQRGVPIYKTIRLSQEKVEDKGEIYEFPDDSQESEKRGKKRKRVVKKPAAKRVKKAATSKPITSKNKENKVGKKVPQTVHFEEPIKKPAIIKNNVDINNIKANIEIPEHLQNAGNSTFEEASTIKILSDQKLEGSKKINLTATPPVPKTIASELKLYGPKNAITSQPTKQYSNMVNHSLIRQSMSPITKIENNNFDAGSPWRPIETFSRVQRIVQSTPQINRLPLVRGKKLPIPLTNFKNQSINSLDTIHVSSIDDGKLPNKKNQGSVNSSMKENEVPSSNKNETSPRKFGTVISNLSPVQSKTSSNTVNNNPAPNQETSAPVTMPSENFEDVPMDEIPTILVNNNKENTIPSPKKSPKKKINTPSPFRFEKIRSSKRLASMESASKSPKPKNQKEADGCDPEAGPSWLDKPKPAVLRQSNLNNFLNLDEMPESTRISTIHGIFDDAHSTPINGKKPRSVISEPNIENAFGFDDFSVNEMSPVKKSSVIATEKDVKESVKGKLFPKARVKSAMPLRISANTVKKALLTTENLKKQNEKQNKSAIFNDSDEYNSDQENDTYRGNDTYQENDTRNNVYPETAKKAVLDAVTFSDTFDVQSENGDIELKIPKEIPLFVDLEPAHFTQPPRRSYCKRKREVNFDVNNTSAESDNDNEPKKKKKKKKPALSKEERKRMEAWVKNINNTFDEIDHFDLVVE